MQYLHRVTLILIIFFTYSLDTSAQITWIGLGDGLNWSDAANWDSAPLLPLAGDDVIIADGSTVQINTTGTVALSVTIANGSILNIISGSLVIDNQFDLDGITLGNTGTINISAGASLAVSNTFYEGFYIDSGIGTINNAGTITLGDIDGNIIYVDVNSLLNFNNQATGVIRTTGFTTRDFLFIPSAANDNSIITNSGSIDISFVINGFHIDAKSTLDNHGTIKIDSTGDDAFSIDNEVVVTNHTAGIINLSDIDGKSLDINTASKFINDGQLNINHIIGGVIESEESIDVDSPDAAFTNNGTLTITGTEDSESIDIEGLFTNNGLINVGVAPSGDEAIGVDATGQLLNNLCGIINISTADSIDNNAGIIDNKGIITTNFTGSNTNTGTFSNSGVLSAPSSNFNVVGNAVVNSGTITSTPIPATQALCNIPVVVPPPFIPTLSQWGLLILGLLILNFSIAFIYRLKESAS